MSLGAVPSPLPQPDIKQVRIKLDANGKIVVEPESQTLNAKNEQVRWVPETPEKFVVSFDADSPFERGGRFDEGQDTSGPIKADAAEKGYKYTVRMRGQTLDPEIIVTR